MRINDNPVRTPSKRWKGLLLLLAILALSGCGKPADIAYLRYTDGYWQVWLTDPEGRNHRQITTEPIDKTRISWSSDRTELLCNRNDGSLARVSLKEKTETPVKLPLEGMLDAQWSPDGQSVAFSLNTAQSMDNNDLWVVSLTDGERRKLTNRPGVEQSPSWDARGEVLVYSGGRATKGYDIWRLELASGNDTQLTVAGGNKFDPVINEKDAIAYAANTSGSYDIWLLEEGGTPRALTSDPAYEAQPSWSPNGKKLAFYALRGGKKRIWVMDREGKEPKPITPEDALSRYPVWAR